MLSLGVKVSSDMLHTLFLKCGLNQMMYFPKYNLGVTFIKQKFLFARLS